MKSKKKLNLWHKLTIGILTPIVVIIAAFGIYAADYYHADETAVDTALSEAEASPEITVTSSNSSVIFDVQDARTGLIFYPGGKVEYRAYIPLMVKIAEQGITCILPKMPLNLAVFDVNSASRYLNDYPSITDWYVGGNSLGGSMAATFASKHTDEVTGLILFASYSISDLTGGGLKVLSLYGSEDHVLNLDSYAQYASNLPTDFTEYVIAGGNHSGFGNYGHQKGDGDATITSKAQQDVTAEHVRAFCLSE